MPAWHTQGAPASNPTLLGAFWRAQRIAYPVRPSMTRVTKGNLGSWPRRRGRGPGGQRWHEACAPRSASGLSRAECPGTQNMDPGQRMWGVPPASGNCQGRVGGPGASFLQVKGQVVAPGRAGWLRLIVSSPGHSGWHPRHHTLPPHPTRVPVSTHFSDGETEAKEGPDPGHLAVGGGPRPGRSGP